MYLKDVEIDEMKGKRVLSATGKSGIITDVRQDHDVKITINWEAEGPSDIFLGWEKANPLIEIADEGS